MSDSAWCLILTAVLLIVVIAVVVAVFAPDGGCDGMGGCEHP